MNKCIIVGLPDSGKSTYIGAFWAIEKDADTGHKLMCSKYPDDTTYLDSLKKDWHNQRIVNRSSQIEKKDIVLELTDSLQNRTISVCIPDFKGERFASILQNNINDEVDEWLSKSDSVLFFIKYAEKEILQEELGTDAGTYSNSAPTALRLSDMTDWSKNIMLLKYIIENYPNIRKYSICISAWDKVDEEKYPSVESWLKAKSPFMYNFLKHNVHEYNLYGVSAQGLDYEDYPAGEDPESIQIKTENHQRAFVYDKEKSFDITKPLYSLIKD